MGYPTQLSSHPASHRGARAAACAAWLLTAASCGSASPTKAELVGVQGGTFIMGATTGCSDGAGTACAGDRVPHKVRVSPFKIDNVEVTRRLFAECVKKGACLAPGATFAEDSDQPALVDDPAQARAYCATRSMRLPTEAEFEFLSRLSLTGDPQNFAWGNQPPTCSRLPMKGCAERRPRPVGTSPGDVNIFGIFDLAGSVPEWVDDDYTPYIGCADRMSYGELCWGKNAGCTDTRCANDGPFCAVGCLPGQASTSGGGADGPVCPASPDAALLIDPIVRGDYPFHVVRGGGPDDTACAFAGFTRRYAAVKSFAAGFRCAVSLDARPRTGTSTYRFALTGCPPAGRVRVSLKSGAAAAGYTLDWFPNGATGIKSATADKGIVDDVPCDAVMVVYPSTTENVSISVSTVGNPAACYAVTAAPTLSSTTDTPIKGVDTLKLMPAMGCP